MAKIQKIFARANNENGVICWNIPYLIHYLHFMTRLNPATSSYKAHGGVFSLFPISYATYNIKSP